MVWIMVRTEVESTSVVTVVVRGCAVEDAPRAGNTEADDSDLSSDVEGALVRQATAAQLPRGMLCDGEIEFSYSIATAESRK
jgi:hypothetical protein